MKRHRHTPEQFVRKLREGERLLNYGKDLTEVLRHLEISEAPRTARATSTAASKPTRCVASRSSSGRTPG